MVSAVVAGLVAGAVIAALAGARRTESAYGRFLRQTRAFDVAVTNGGTTATNINRQFDFEAVSRLPQVAEAVLVNTYFLSGTLPSGRSLFPSDITPFTSADGRFGRDINRMKILRGRLPRGQHEIVVTFFGAGQLGIDVGGSVRLRLAGPAAMAAEPQGGAAEPFAVVGAVAMQGGFPPLTGGLPPLLMLSPYARAHRDALEVFAVRLRRGVADTAGFERELNRLARGEQVVLVDTQEQTSVVERGLTVQATALRLLAAVVATVALLLLAQSLARQAYLDARDNDVLRALGFTRRDLVALAGVRSIVVALAAALVAGVAAVALSPLTPVGVARKAELDPGIQLNAAYVGVGVAVVVAVTFLLGIAVASWAGRGTGLVADARVRPSRLAALLARVGLSAPAVSGMRMGLESGRGRTALPVRSTIMGAALGVATIAGMVTFAASLHHLFDDPRLYGWNWDVQVGDAFAPDLSATARAVNARHDVDAVAVGTLQRLQIGALDVDAMGIQPLRGAIAPTVVAGRAPRRPGEILLGARTLRDLHVDVGDTVAVGYGTKQSSMRVVGRGVLTEFAGAARLGEGGALTLAGMRKVVPHAAADVVLVRMRPGARVAGVLREFDRAAGQNVYLPDKPSDLADLERVGGVPSVVAGLLGVMAVATLAHTLMASVSRRRRDLAILKVLGFERRQVSAAVAWQSSTVAAIAVIVGLPAGVAAGRWAWRLFATQLGVPPHPVTPLLAIALLLTGTVLLANLVAALPARLAARTRPTAVLQAE